ncbi:uncharacterized protein V1510DRAFT_417744 [Dipodascopsis tothii]|uniref:uncharacterized protein n=1 Tax=Dipodascopsis tothii TaxID=44089 RepID=UPI0034CEE3BF
MAADSAPPPGAPPARPRVAVVGTGLAGLATAYYLGRDRRFDIELFDSNPTIGLDAASLTVTTDAGRRRVDVPMRSLAGGYYTNVLALYRELGLRLERQWYSFSFSATTDGTYYIHQGQGGWRGTRLPGRVRAAVRDAAVRARKAHTAGGASSAARAAAAAAAVWAAWASRTLFIAVCYIYFTALCLAVDPPADMSLEAFLGRWLVPAWFADRFVVPMFAAMGTCTLETIRKAPAHDVVIYKRRTFLQPHFHLRDNVRAAVTRLLVDIPADRRHLGVAVENVAQRHGRWTLRAGGRVHTFDHVVLAVPPGVAAAMLTDESDYVRQTLMPLLQAVKSTVVEVCVHQDPVVLAHLHPDDVSDLNFVIDGDAIESTHVLGHGVFQTTNPVVSPMLSGVLGRSVFERVTRSAAVDALADELARRNARGAAADASGLWVCGSWAWRGQVLLEGCVTSALDVAAAVRAASPKTR